MEIKDIAIAAYNWVEQDDSKRTVLVITSEKQNITEEGYTLLSSKTINGKIGQTIEALVDTMKDDKRFADVIIKASLAYTTQHSTPIGIGVISNEWKESKDE